jgi:hypothetical protein
MVLLPFIYPTGHNEEIRGPVKRSDSSPLLNDAERVTGRPRVSTKRTLSIPPDKASFGSADVPIRGPVKRSDSSLLLNDAERVSGRARVSTSNLSIRPDKASFGSADVPKAGKRIGPLRSSLRRVFGPSREPEGPQSLKYIINN